VYYSHTPLTITGPLVLAVAGETKTIMVNGNVTINANITVPPDRFLAIVASGDITFGPDVTDAQGIYIADGALTVSNANPAWVGVARQFKGQGVFVGWGGVNLRRNLNGPDTTDDAMNSGYPAELFTYRPDYMVNTPDSLKRSRIIWQEIAPLSQGE